MMVRRPPLRFPLRPCALLAPLLLLLLSAEPARPQDPPGAEGKDEILLGKSCVTSSCHADQKEVENAHDPVASGSCDVCHVSEEGKHRFHLAREDAALCSFCHEAYADSELLETVHGPVAVGECTACHDPHRSDHGSLLLESPGADLCYSCHDRDEVQPKGTLHGPIEEGECLLCHDPHSSDQAKLLLQPGRKLCYECHVEFEEGLEARENWHAPAAESCSHCHDPHSSDLPLLLGATVPDLCWRCHEDLKEDFNRATNIHKAVEIEDKCLNCHDPHASDHGAILKTGMVETCLGCHDKKIEVEGGRPLRNMKELLGRSTVLHGPIAEGDCASCHRPHAASTYRSLVDVFPADFYAPFKLEQYGLCFQCHDDALVLAEMDGEATGFRDGEQNLHYAHVNRERKGRTCRACHAIHGSSKEFLIRDRVPFGGWMIPIHFKKLDGGGSCTPGCHERKEYRRK
ncbi:MAG: cytochrome c3 family protein [Planctomycetota bacterium]